MLTSLFIKNFALIDEIKIDFTEGLNILTGETGAGKSIIIGALSVLLGEKIDKEMVRQGESKAVVEGFFNITNKMLLQLEQLDVSCDGGELIIRQEIHRNGRNRSFLNDSPVNNALLVRVGDLLIDLHGQHSHQALLKVKKHINYLDDYGVPKELLTLVSTSYKNLIGFKNKLKQLQEQNRLLREKRELLEFQVKEIEEIAPELNEENELEKEERILKSSEKIHQISEQIKDIIYDGEGSAFERLSNAEEQFSSMIEVDEKFSQWTKNCKTARVYIEEVVNSLQNYSDAIEFNPQRLEEIRDRLGQFTLLKKKYGGTIEEVLKFCLKAGNDLKKIDSTEKETSDLKEEIKKEKKNYAELAGKLSEVRTKASLELEKKTIEVFAELGLRDGIFEIDITQAEDSEGDIRINENRFKAGEKGIDEVEFFISLNPGEKPKPLVKIASGGEISRIMLALKNVLADADNIPVVVFDEIDSGISGRIARSVGTNLKEAATKHQIVCITHLPLIASLGNTHFTVEKKVENNRTFTTIRPLDEQERVNELAKLIGGEMLNQTTLQNARDLLKGE